MTIPIAGDVLSVYDEDTCESRHVKILRIHNNGSLWLELCVKDLKSRRNKDITLHIDTIHIVRKNIE